MFFQKYSFGRGGGVTMYHLGEGNLRIKLIFWASAMSYVGGSELWVGKLKLIERELASIIHPGHQGGGQCVYTNRSAIELLSLCGRERPRNGKPTKNPAGRNPPALFAARPRYSSFSVIATVEAKYSLALWSNAMLWQSNSFAQSQFIPLPEVFSQLFQDVLLGDSLRGNYATYIRDLNNTLPEDQRKGHAWGLASSRRRLFLPAGVRPV